MVDVIVPNVPVLEIGRPKASSIAYALATVIGYARPYEFPDLAELAQTIQRDYEGNASVDTPLTKEQITDALNKYGVLFIDEQPLLDKAKTSSDYSDVRHELGAQNRQSVIQLLLLSRGDKLALAVDNPNTNNDPNAPLSIDGSLLHGWLSNAPYSIVRTGLSTDKPIGRYIDPLTTSLDLPCAITWDNVSNVSGIEAIFSIPSGAVKELPPSDFRYFGGLDASGNPVTNTWPPVAKGVDTEKLIQHVQAMMSKSDADYSTQIAQINTLASQIATSVTNVANLLNDDKSTADANFMSLLHELGLPDETPPTTTPVPDPTNGNPAGQLI